MTHYETLDISPDATPALIKARYRSFAQRYHPDKPRGDVKRYQAIQEAYDVLSDPEKRAKYDRGDLEFRSESEMIERHAQMNLLQVFTKMVESLDFERAKGFDFNSELASTVRGALVGLDSQLHQNKMGRKKIKEIQRRIGGEAFIFRGLMRQQRLKLIQERKSIKFARKVVLKSQEILTNFNYQNDPPTVNSSHGFSIFTVSLGR